MLLELLECCGVKTIVGANSETYLDCFKNNSGKWFKAKLKDGREIQKEILLVTFCRQCGHYVLKYLWYANRNSSFHNYDESKDIRGKQADEIFSRRIDDFELWDIPETNQTSWQKQSKKIPWKYYKATSKTTCVQRYIDETETVSRKIYCPIKKV